MGLKVKKKSNKRYLTQDLIWTNDCMLQEHLLTVLCTIGRNKRDKKELKFTAVIDKKTVKIKFHFIVTVDSRKWSRTIKRAL